MRISGIEPRRGSVGVGAFVIGLSQISSFFPSSVILSKILRINKFLEISPSTAFQARAVTGMILYLQRC